MPQQPIVPLGESAAVVLPTEVLQSLGLRIGDMVEVTPGDRQLIVRPVEDADRRRVIQGITQEVFERRRDAYQRLA
jgi:antitoxin component of MazEF toxin-antitoxin module